VALQLPPLTVVEQLTLQSPMSVMLNGGCVVQLRTAPPKNISRNKQDNEHDLLIPSGCAYAASADTDPEQQLHISTILMRAVTTHFAAATFMYCSSCFLKRAASCTATHLHNCQ
jgi:hypothetical protein